MSILDGELADILQAALVDADIPYSCIITRETPGTGPIYDPGDPVITPYDCLGWVDDYRADQIDGTIILANDRRVYVLANSLAITPLPTDRITVRGASFTIISVTADAALATYQVQVRS